ncbi:MAG: 2-C-methyl-D-erythritol 4-phosphate cytidylyltransferase [Campylobacteraceae bacterium]|nr:2-C-methyl-D-erythritol 4-phosphate cytidylyltransferase [Campylobacteraceae bacterium]
MNVAVILSGGSGSRFGSETPKQYINLAGKNIIEYTVVAFEQNENIDEICIVADEAYHDKLLQTFKKSGFKKVRRVISGGAERKDSSYNAIKEYEDKEDINLIFHDAVRPFISQEIINNCIRALEKYSAVDVAIPTADTIIEIDESSKTIKNIPQRSKLQRGQTPQAFKLKTIKKAHELANADESKPLFTDDCGLVKQYLPDEQIFVIDGEERNIKITYPEDLLFAEKLIQLHSISADRKPLLSKLKGMNIVVFGGSSGIGKEIVKMASSHGAKVVEFSKSSGVDVASMDEVKSSLELISKKLGKIDSIINCAATLTRKDLVNMSSNEIEGEVNTNLIGSINIAKASHSYLKKTKGSLLLFTSSSYTRGRAGYSVYSATKAAVVNLTQALCEEWMKDDIRVNVINPARTATPMRERNFGKEDESSLLSAKDVAMSSIDTILGEFNGLVIDVRMRNQ